MIGHSKELSAPSPLTSLQPTPGPHARDLSLNQRGHMTALKQRALPEPAITPSGDDVAPHAHTPASSNSPTAPSQPTHVLFKRAVTSPNSDVALHTPSLAMHMPTEPHAPTLSIVYGPRNLSGLCSGTKNLWGSIQRQWNYSYSPRNRTALHSGSWHSHHSHSYPPCQHHIHLHPELVQHSPYHPQHPKQLWPSCDLNPHSNLRSHLHHSEPPLWSLQQHSLSASSPHPIPINIQLIQHPRRISPQKPKILKNTHTAHCTCGNVIPVHRLDRESWRSTDTRFRRFRRRSRRFWIVNEDVHYCGGGTCDSELCSLHLWERHSHRGFGLD